MPPPFFFFTHFLTVWAKSNTKLQQFQSSLSFFVVKPFVYEWAYAEIISWEVIFRSLFKAKHFSIQLGNERKWCPVATELILKCDWNSWIAKEHLTLLCNYKNGRRATVFPTNITFLHDFRTKLELTHKSRNYLRPDLLLI